MADAEESKKEYHFPDVVLRELFQCLGARDVLAASQTCRQWRMAGLAARKDVRSLRVSDFYVDVINEERFIEHPIFHRREDLHGLTLIKTSYAKKLVRWLSTLFPNVAELAFRNYIRRGPSTETMTHPSRFHIFVIDELMSVVGRAWPGLEMLDASGEIVEVRALHQVKRWPRFRELRLSGADLSYNMLTTRHLIREALTKTFWSSALGALRLSNLDLSFELTFQRMTMFKALNHKSLTTGWLNAMLREAVNLRTLAIDCSYLHDENLVLMGNLVELRDVTLRNCIYADDFSPLGNLPKLHSLVIDFGDKGNEEQMCQIVKGSKNWRRIIFNELQEWVGNGFLMTCTEQFRQHSCPMIELELDTEKTDFKFVHHDWVLPDVKVDGIKAVLDACPLLESFGICTKTFDDACLMEVAEKCPRVRKVYVNDSVVTNEGVLAFYEALRRKRAEKYAGAECGVGVINVQNTKCDKKLWEEAVERYGGELRVLM